MRNAVQSTSETTKYNLIVNATLPLRIRIWFKLLKDISIFYPPLPIHTTNENKLIFNGWQFRRRGPGLII